MTAHLIEDVFDPYDDKDPWPDPPAPPVWSTFTPQQWAAHTIAFEPRGGGHPDQVPTLTVLDDLDRPHHKETKEL